MYRKVTVGHPKRTPVASVMKSNLRARDARFSLKPFSLPAPEAAHTRSNAPPQARSAMTNVTVSYTHLTLPTILLV